MTKKKHLKNQNKKPQEVNQLVVKPLVEKQQSLWPFYLALFLGAVLLYGWTATFDWGLDDHFSYGAVQNANNNMNNIDAVLNQKFGEDYRPVTILSFWLEGKLFNGLLPGRAHFINALIFGLLLIQIFRFSLYGKYFSNDKILVAFALLTTLIFLVHPMHVSVVANIKSRDNLLSMLLGITSSIHFLYFLNNRQWWRIIFIPLFLLLAFLSKSDSYIFIIFPILYALFFSKINWKMFAFVVLIVIFLGQVIPQIKSNIISDHIEGSIVSRVYLDSPLFENDSLINRLSLSLTTMLYYFKFFILPFGHYVYYGIDQIPLLPLFSPLNILSFFIHLFLFIFCILKFKTNRVYLFSLMFYFLAIGYASNLPVIVSGVLTDRYNFIGSLGMCMFVSALAIEYLNISYWKDLFKKWIVAVLIIFAGFAVYRTSAWKNTKTLLLRDIDDVTKSAHTNLMLSSEYINEVIFNNLSTEEADYCMTEAIRYIDRGLKVTDKNPFLYQNSGITSIYFGNNAEAVRYLKKSFELDSTIMSTANYIGIAYRNMNQIDSALHYFEYAMNNTNMFTYQSNNFVSMLIRKERFEAVDSTLNVLKMRFPNDKYLESKIESWKSNKEWYDY